METGTMRKESGFRTPREKLAQMVEKNPDDYELRDRYRARLVSSRDFAGAERQARELVRLNPKGSTTRFIHARHLHDISDLDASVKEYRTALELLDEEREDRLLTDLRNSLFINIDKSEALIRWMFSLALRESGRPAEAESVLREALAIATKIQDDMLVRNLRAELDSLTPSM
jgi:Flp pilus assembly protein TadD